MPAEAQTRLLRALQSGRIRRVGGRQEIDVDVRIIAATNRDLAPLIDTGEFREDLYYRLNVVPIALPPLRERTEDIEELASHFLMAAAEEGLPRRALTPEAVAILEERDWRGNVRELRNFIYRVALMAREDTVQAEHLDEVFEREALGARAPALLDRAGFDVALDNWLHEEEPADGTLYHRALAAFEKPLLEYALSETRGNQLRAAKLLGINRNTLRNRNVELRIEPDRSIRTA